MSALGAGSTEKAPRLLVFNYGIAGRWRISGEGPPMVHCAGNDLQNRPRLAVSLGRCLNRLCNTEQSYSLSPQKKMLQS